MRLTARRGRCWEGKPRLSMGSLLTLSFRCFAFGLEGDAVDMESGDVSSMPSALRFREAYCCTCSPSIDITATRFLPLRIRVAAPTEVRRHRSSRCVWSAGLPSTNYVNTHLSPMHPHTCALLPMSSQLSSVNFTLSAESNLRLNPA